MKVALCLHGFADGLSSKTVAGGQRVPIDWVRGFEHYARHILKTNEHVDVFMHSWNNKSQQDLTNAYFPISTLFEPYKKFNATNKYIHSAYSRWYSALKSVELKKQHEQERGFVYDFVMLGRFDIAWRTDVDFTQFDTDFFYLGNWNQAYKNDRVISPNDYYFKNFHKDPSVCLKPHGWPHKKTGAKAVCDHWFFCNSKMMDEFAQLFNRIGKYLQKMPNTTNHIMSMDRLMEMDVVDRIRFVFKRYDDFPLVRHFYHDWRKKT